MIENAHIFTPSNNSLLERLNAYRSVHKAWLNIEASLKHADDPEWADTLGDMKELEEAHEIIVRSLKVATQSISIEELDQAQEQGLISSDEATQFIDDKHVVGHQLNQDISSQIQI